MNRLAGSTGRGGPGGCGDRGGRPRRQGPQQDHHGCGPDGPRRDRGHPRGGPGPGKPPDLGRDPVRDHRAVHHVRRCHRPGPHRPRGVRGCRWALRGRGIHGQGVRARREPQARRHRRRDGRRGRVAH